MHYYFNLRCEEKTRLVRIDSLLIKNELEFVEIFLPLSRLQIQIKKKEYFTLFESQQSSDKAHSWLQWVPKNPAVFKQINNSNFHLGEELVVHREHIQEGKCENLYSDRQFCDIALGQDCTLFHVGVYTNTVYKMYFSRLKWYTAS